MSSPIQYSKGTQAVVLLLSPPTLTFSQLVDKLELTRLQNICLYLDIRTHKKYKHIWDV